MGLGDVVDQLLDEHGLADARAAEQADLAALGVGREQVDDLDAGHEDLRLGRLLDIGRRRLVDGARLLDADRAGLVHRLADHVHDAAERAGADRHGDRRAGVLHRLAAHQTFGGVHGDAAHGDSPSAAPLRAPGACPGCSVSSAFRIAGSCPSNCTSTTAPMTCATRPVVFSAMFAPVSPAVRPGEFVRRPQALHSERLGARNDLDEFLGDHRLARPVVEDRLLLDHLAGVSGRRVHGAHLGAHLGRHILESAR